MICLIISQKSKLIFLKAKRLQKNEPKLGFASWKLFKMAKATQYFCPSKPTKVITATYLIMNI